jgi:CheY-like chemotaxis protein
MKDEFTIFYTDDDQDDLEFFMEIVENINANVTVVTQKNGQQLLNALDNPPPSPCLIFLDINMPGMTGLETLKIVRESGKHTNLPIIMFSTSNDQSTIQKSMELGASYYLPKSSIFEHLKQSIEHALRINWGSFIPNEKNFVYSY